MSEWKIESDPSEVKERDRKIAELMLVDLKQAIATTESRLAEASEPGRKAAASYMLKALQLARESFEGSAGVSAAGELLAIIHDSACDRVDGRG